MDNNNLNEELKENIGTVTEEVTENIENAVEEVKADAEAVIEETVADAETSVEEIKEETEVKAEEVKAEVENAVEEVKEAEAVVEEVKEEAEFKVEEFTVEATDKAEENVASEVTAQETTAYDMGMDGYKYTVSDTDYEEEKLVEDKKGMLILALIFGIASVVCCVIPVVPFLFALAGLILSIIGKKKTSKRGLATAAMVISIIGLGLGLIIGCIDLLALFAAILDNL